MSWLYICWQVDLTLCLITLYELVSASDVPALFGLFQAKRFVVMKAYGGELCSIFYFRGAYVYLGQTHGSK